jgi:MoaA/NifB/PqqE/SkfB family radical SAM enzyme
MHIETTTRCTLACPGCPRTEIADKLGAFPKRDLVVEDLVNFLDCDSGQQIKSLLLEGNHGDPIYYPDLIKLIDAFRSTKTFTIVTNGSHRDAKFWHTLASKLTPADLIIFSIDGLEHNNHLYRKNSNWASIMLGLDIMTKSGVQVGWKTLIFDYNHSEIDQIRTFAESRGAKFVSESTARFGDESLRPPEQFVELNRDYQSTIKKNIDIHPQCDNHEKEYISADGYYWPCCWVSSAFTLYKSQLWKDRQNWTMTGNTLDTLRKRLDNWVDNIVADPDNADIVCKLNCKPENPKFPINHGLT